MSDATPFNADLPLAGPPDRIAPSVMVVFHQMAETTSIETITEGGVDIDPRNPLHALALFVQHNALDLLPQAALWLMAVTQKHRQERIAAQDAQRAEAAANESAIVMPHQAPAVVAQPIVDASGQAIVVPTEAQDFLSPDPAAAVAVLEANPEAAAARVESEGGEL